MKTLEAQASKHFKLFKKDLSKVYFWKIEAIYKLILVRRYGSYVLMDLSKALIVFHTILLQENYELMVSVKIQLFSSTSILNVGNRK